MAGHWDKVEKDFNEAMDLQATSGFGGDPYGLVYREFSFPHQNGLQVLPLGHRHHHEGDTVSLAHKVDWQDIGMPELCDRPRRSTAEREPRRFPG